MRALTVVVAIARNTFREAIRDKVLYAFLLFAVALKLFALAMGELSLGEQVRTTRDIGLFGMSLLAVLTAVFIGVSFVYKELDRKTIFVLIPKPIHRTEFVAGKFLGMAATLAVNVAIMGAVMALVVRGAGGHAGGELVRAVVLVYDEVVIVTAVAVFFSSFTSPFLSGAFTLGIFLLGRSADALFALAGKLGQPLRAGLQGIARVLPNLYYFYPSGRDVAERHLSISTPESFVDWAYVGGATLYALFYVVIVVTLAALIFSRRDFV